MLVATDTTQATIAYGTDSIICGYPDSDGTEWYMTEVDYGGGEVTSGSYQYPSDHGGSLSEQWLAPRVMNLKLFSHSPSREARERARVKVRSVFPAIDLATITFSEATPLLTTARRNGPILETRYGKTDARYEVALIAPDPRLYGTSLKTVTLIQTAAPSEGLTFPITFPITFPDNTPQASSPVTNYGNIETPATITLYGPRTTPGILNETTNQRITFSQMTLVSGDILQIDLLDRLAYLNGAMRAADITSSWFRFDPGATVVSMLGDAPLSSGGLIEYRDAYDL